MKKIIVPLMMLVLLVTPVCADVTFQDLPDAYSVDCTSFGCAGWEQTIVNDSWVTGGYASDDDNTTTVDCSYDDWMGVKLDYLVEYEKPLEAMGGNLSVWIYLEMTGQCPTGKANLTQYNLTIPEDCWDYNTTTVHAKVGVQQYDGSGWERTDVYCLNDTSSWKKILDLDGGFDDYGMPLAETGMFWIFPDEPESQYTPVQASMIMIVTIVLGLGLVALTWRELSAEFSVTTIITLVLIAIIFVSFMRVLVQLVYG